MDIRSDIETPLTTKKVGWDAIFAGTITAIVVGSFLNALGIAFGLFAFKPDSTNVIALGGGAIFWIIISTLIYSFIGGFIAARFSYVRERAAGMLNGFIAWSLASIFTILVISSAGGFMLNSTIKIASHAFDNTMQVLPQAVQDRDRDANVDRNVVEKAKAVTPEAANYASKTLASMMLIVAFMSVIGAGASLLGGYMGINRKQVKYKL